MLAGTPVGTSLIDAHAGGVGVMESVPVSDPDCKGNCRTFCRKLASYLCNFFVLTKYLCPALDEEAICHRMVLVCGTSTCHMAVSRSKLFIPGVWGPFWSGMTLELNMSSMALKYQSM